MYFANSDYIFCASINKWKVLIIKSGSIALEIISLYKKSEKIRQLFCLLSYCHLLVISNLTGWYFCEREGLRKFSKYVCAYVTFFPPESSNNLFFFTLIHLAKQQMLKKCPHLFSLFFVKSYLLKKCYTLFLYLWMEEGILFGISWPGAFSKGFQLNSPHWQTARRSLARA